MMMSNSTRDGLSFGEFLLALGRYWYIWLVTALIVTAGAFAWGKRTTVPTYSAASTVMIYHPNNDPNQRNADVLAMASYRKIVKSNTIVQPVQQQLTKINGYHGDQTALTAGISTTVAQNTLNLKLSAQGTSAKLAAQTANLLAKSVQQQLPTLVPNSGTVQIIEQATTKQATLINGNRVQKLTLGGLLFGLYLGILATFIYTAWRR
ncbi:YveK family protein [Loigolactobacillus jiayinensis]|uniref:YveK family protein n=1 Tax=Loigolactobacillus jiayinensis TaxID=2486016 RepID=A0ABW1RCW5_9LACO|nr:exopolysaccharide biosynthesis protein [Loigolactobacillus jiayinensis]